MSTPLRIAFAGTPDFAVPCLQALLDSEHQVVAVYSQPDRPAGRGRKLQPSPVKKRACEYDIAVYQPLNFKTDESKQALIDLNIDLFVVVAYGLLLPVSVLNTPRLGCINVHASLLPRWRGAAPIQRAIEAGDTRTGVAVMQMEKGLDTGPVYQMSEIDINEHTTASLLHDQLAELGAKTLIDTLPDIIDQAQSPKIQALEGVTYAAKLDKAEARIDWTQSANKIARDVRAFHGFPVCETQWNGKKVRIWEAKAVTSSDSKGFPPGCVLAQNADGVMVATGEGCLLVSVLQLPGKKMISARDFNNSNQCIGDTFE